MKLKDLTLWDINKVSEGAHLGMKRMEELNMTTVKSFSEVSENDLMDIDGGNWRDSVSYAAGSGVAAGLKMAAKGAKTGAVLGPKGALGGALIGFIAGVTISTVKSALGS